MQEPLFHKEKRTHKSFKKQILEILQKSRGKNEVILSRTTSV